MAVSSKKYTVKIARSMEDYMRVVALRAIIYMGDQSCPYDEEFDGNDLSASHLILFCGDEPIGALRLRWFAEWVKLERVCILANCRSRDAFRTMVDAAVEFAARKGYRRLIGYIQSRLYPLWTRSYPCRRRTNRPEFHVSDFPYTEVEFDIPPHPEVLTADSSPYILLRPEGAWDDPGVLDKSAARSGFEHAAVAA